jgi:hypothetical protein
MNPTNALPHIDVQQVVTQLNQWWTLLLLPVGAGIWHMILKIYPWTQDKGGLLRGVGYFFWIPKGKQIQPTQPKQSPMTAPPLNP